MNSVAAPVPHPHAVLSALSLALLTALADAAPQAPQTSWTGLAGEGQPFWDLNSNWSAGAPQSGATQALLGSFHTTVRGQNFTVGTVTGDGTLTQRGGALKLAAPGSFLGRLLLQGGRLSGGGTLAVTELDWSGGGLEADAGEAAGPALTVRGAAHLSGTLASTRARLTLLGTSTVTDGAGLHFSGSGARFDNGGHFDAGGFGADFSLAEGAQWINSGTLTVSRGALRGDKARLTQAGTFNIADGGEYHVSTYAEAWQDPAASLTSTGQWHIGRGANLRFTNGGRGFDAVPSSFARFTAGEVHNRGSLFVEHGAVVEFSAAARLSGPGRVDVEHDGAFRHAGSLQIGWLSISTAVNPNDLRDARVKIGGDLTVDSLDWGSGFLEVGGTVTVNGRARLTGYTSNVDSSGGYYQSKQMDARYVFKDEVQWDGAASIEGRGAILIEPGSTFHDHNNSVIVDHHGQRYPTRINLALIDNHGTYWKHGIGQTAVGGSFTNFGSLRLTDAELMVLGHTHNLGTFEVERSRLHVGELQQLNRLTQTLEGGRYVVRDGTLVIDNAGGSVPLRHNRAEVVLDGPAARMLGDSEHGPLLATLVSNRGSLSVLNGASLEMAALAQEEAVLVVGAGSSVQMAGDFTQYRSQTWVAGRLAAHTFTFGLGSVFSAGLQGEIGVAELVGDRASFASGVLWVDVADRGQFDTVNIDGATQLEGLLQLAFGDVSKAMGSYRILKADDGVSGRFTSIESNLDPALYRLGVIYGAEHVDVWVRAVPEVETGLLTALGLLALAARRAWHASGQRGGRGVAQAAWRVA